MPNGHQPGQAALDAVRAAPSRKVKVAVCDLDGVLRGKYLHADKFLAAAEGGGFGFCNVVFGWDSGDQCYDNCRFTGWHSGYPDATARIDLSTWRSIPWEDGVPFFLGDFAGATPAVPGCPRSLLRTVVDRAQRRGFSPKIGVEYEWFNFAETPKSAAAKRYAGLEPLTPGMFGYSLIRIGNNRPYFTALMDEMRAFGIPLEGLHTETGPGVFEAAIMYGDAVESADRACLFKTAAKEIGARFGIMPTFMAKPSAQLPGCSGHVHQSLWDAAGGANLFGDPSQPLGMTPLYRHYLAGLLQALPEILPMFAPTVNSYKRLVDGYWAPTKPTWGVDNRTVAFRHIGTGSKSTRLEARVPGSDSNPYLAVAACLAAGLRGIERQLPLEAQPVAGSAYQSDAPRLPRTLLEATQRMRDSALARELFGEAFVEHFTASRLWEWRQFQDAVTDWELARYFEII